MGPQAATWGAPRTRPAQSERDEGLFSNVQPCICLPRGPRRARRYRSTWSKLPRLDRQQVVAYSSGEEAGNALSNTSSSEQKEEGATIRRTLGNLDALLGIEEEAPKDSKAGDNKVIYTKYLVESARRGLSDMTAEQAPHRCATQLLQAEATGRLEVGYSPEVIRQLAEAEAERGKFKPDLDGLHELEKQMVRSPVACAPIAVIALVAPACNHVTVFLHAVWSAVRRAAHSLSTLHCCGVQASIAEKAKQAVADGADEKKSEQLLRTEFEKLLQLLRPETSVEKADLQLLKDRVFGPQTFFVTETRLTEEYLKDAGWLVRSLARSFLVTAGCHGSLSGEYAVAFVGASCGLRLD